MTKQKLQELKEHMAFMQGFKGKRAQDAADDNKLLNFDPGAMWSGPGVATPLERLNQAADMIESSANETLKANHGGLMKEKANELFK